jgi:hypothetical protein
MVMMMVVMELVSGPCMCDGPWVGTGVYHEEVATLKKEV